MKKLFLFIGIALCIQSCKKATLEVPKEEDTEPVKFQPKKITMIPLSWERSDTIVLAVGYNSDNRITQLKSKDADLRFEYNEAGNLARMASFREGVLETNNVYSYNSSGKLSHAISRGSQDTSQVMLGYASNGNCNFFKYTSSDPQESQYPFSIHKNSKDSLILINAGIFGRNISLTVNEGSNVVKNSFAQADVVTLNSGLKVQLDRILYHIIVDADYLDVLGNHIPGDYASAFPALEPIYYPLKRTGYQNETLFEYKMDNAGRLIRLDRIETLTVPGNSRIVYIEY